MNYLCAMHRRQVSRSPELAYALWQTAFQQGQQAYWQGDWHRARRGFGSAFDVARIRLADAEQGLISPFDESRLVASADGLARSLYQLGIGQEAEAVARFAHHYLVRQQARCHLTRDRRRQLARLAADVQALLAGLFDALPVADGVH